MPLRACLFYIYLIFIKLLTRHFIIMHMSFLNLISHFTHYHKFGVTDLVFSNCTPITELLRCRFIQFNLIYNDIIYGSRCWMWTKKIYPKEYGMRVLDSVLHASLIFKLTLSPLTLDHVNCNLACHMPEIIILFGCF